MDRKPFAHGVPHLHLLWRREGSKVGLTGILVEDVERGLVCHDGSDAGYWRSTMTPRRRSDAVAMAQTVGRRVRVARLFRFMSGKHS